MKTKKTKKKEKALKLMFKTGPAISARVLMGFVPNEQPAPAIIMFGGDTLESAQDKVFDYVDERRPIICELALRDFARQKGYTWMSGEYSPTNQYLMRFRGQDVATFSAVGVTPSEAEDKARMVLKCLPDAKAAA